MSIQEQVKIMKLHLDNFDTLLEKMNYMYQIFDNDPEYSKEARGIVRGDIAKDLKI